MRRVLSRSNRRKGSVLPLVCVCLVGLLGCVALAVDLGEVALAHSQCQHAADATAMAAARALNGTPDNNEPGAYQTGRQIAALQRVLNVPVNPDTELTLKFGSYVYDEAAAQFRYEFPRTTPGENLTMAQATVTRVVPMLFSRVFGFDSITVSATATCLHRPRDVVLVMDFSGSMNNESDLWNTEGYLGGENNSPNNLDPRVPRFAHYSYKPSPTTELLITTSTSPMVGRCNITQPALGVRAMVDNYYQDASYTVPAFASAGSGDAEGYVGGDRPLRVGGAVTGTGQYAKTVSEITGSTALNTNFEQQGYDYYYNLAKAGGAKVSPFSGYIRGPAYYGKTFFMWPPDPRAPVGQPNSPGVNPPGTPTPGVYVPGDWRQRFFTQSEGGTATVRDNLRLWSTAGAWRDPVNGTGGYQINYGAILKWIKYAGPNPFPPRLQAGRVLYYDSIPDDLTPAAYNPNYPSRNMQDPNERFWREYIDYVLGVWKDPYGNIQRPGNPACSYGPDFVWNSGSNNTVSLSNRPTDGRYMSYTDRPMFPRHRFWFGPMTLIQYLSDTGNLPGTATDISAYTLKLGVMLALQDIQFNYPNTRVSLVAFSRPRFKGEPQEGGRFTTALVPMTSDYTSLIYALWYPQGVGPGQVIRPWDLPMEKALRANGDYNSNTSSYYAFMVAHNELSSSPTARSYRVGGGGRKGSDKLVIFETDGMANVSGQSAPHFRPSESYYDLRYSVQNGITQSNVAPGYSKTPGDAALEVVQRMVAQETDMVNGPGFGRPNTPVTIHCLAFGAIFEPVPNPPAEKANGVAFFQQISAAGNTVFPSSPADPDNGYKWIIGDMDERKTRMRQAVMQCMRSGVHLALVPNQQP
jgi:Flp pilus assembly protein TadG